MNRVMVFILLVMALVTLFGCGANSGSDIKAARSDIETPKQTKLLWDPSIDEPYLKGYNVYWSINGENYVLVKSILDPHAVELSLNDIPVSLNPSLANFFYLTAVDTRDLESVPSNRVCWGTACPEVGPQ